MGVSQTVKFGLLVAILGWPPVLSRAQEVGQVAKATVTVDFQESRGPRLHVEQLNNLSRWTTFTDQRDSDVAFYNRQGLHGHIYRTWVDASRVYNAATGNYDYSGLDDYLADVSRLSDEILMVMDTRVEIRDHGWTPEQIKPLIKTIMRDLKEKYPSIRYIEAFNEPDYNLAKVIKPEQLYDFYKVYYEAVNEINQELKPEVPLEVGGPAFMMYNEPWLRAFLDRYKADASPAKRLDFISYHAYGEFPEGMGDANGPRAYHFYKGDPSEVANQRERLEAELRSRGLDVRIPSFITELGIYPGPSFDHQNDPRPDYLIGAAGVPSLLYWFAEQPRTFPFNWVLRHNSGQRKDQLLTRVGEGKPVPTDTFTPYGNALLMMSKLKDERVVAESSALSGGKGVYAIATKDTTGAAVMLWNYQHTGSTTYDVDLDLGRLPDAMRGKTLCQRIFRIDDKTSNYWGDPTKPNLQQVSVETVKPDRQYKFNLRLTPNSLELLSLEAAQACGA